ncbi:MAG: OmpA family protein [Bacteroidetes bacterium]|nr:MAG: OmpA family protein [Bacteroidota bacterium]
MKTINKFLVPFLLLFLSQISNAQQVIWADQVLEYTDRFQLENNFTELVLGPASVYPNSDINDPHDPYTEGYIVHYEDTKRENVIKVGFSKPMNARQVIIGGIFNIGTIKSISIIDKNNTPKVVYTQTKEQSKTKFKSFSVMCTYSTIYGVKIVLDHSKINQWNLIKGIGITNAEKQFKIEPFLIEDTTHTHTKEVIGENINSKDCFEFSPKIAPDGKTMYFVKECENVPDQDIWYTEKDSLGKWKEAKNIGMPLNNKGHNFVASISPDGQTLIVGNRYTADGEEAGDGVSISHKKSDGTWGNPETLDIPEYANKNDHSNFYLNGDSDVLIMAIEDKNSIGELDLYVSKFDKMSKKWSAPLNLGNTINSIYAEDYPYLAIDGKTLYFSSKGQIGYGGHDIYMSTRLDDTWKNWSKPKNLGPFVNSKSDDKGFSIASEGDHAYFNSAGFNSDLHHMDIYRVDLPKILHQIPRILLKGVCTNAKTKEPVRATITIKENSEDAISFCTSNPKTGEYVMSVPYGKKYTVNGEALEFFKKQQLLDLTGKMEVLEMQLNIEFNAFMDTGVVVKMENLLFEYKVSKILESSYTSLDVIADMMKQQSKSIFEIAGHTDNVASDEFNQKLSLERAQAVVNYLISKGIESKRLKFKGYGKSMPIATNDTEVGRTQNRRVEFKVLEKNAFLAAPKTTKKNSRFKKSK